MTEPNQTMTDGHSRRLLAVVIAVVVAFSMIVPFAGTAVAGQQAGQNSIVAETSGPVKQFANPDQPGAAIDPALKRADGLGNGQLALNSGTLNGNGNYTPSDDVSADRESTDKLRSQTRA